MRHIHIQLLVTTVSNDDRPILSLTCQGLEILAHSLNRDGVDGASSEGLTDSLDPYAPDHFRLVFLKELESVMQYYDCLLPFLVACGSCCPADVSSLYFNQYPIQEKATFLGHEIREELALYVKEIHSQCVKRRLGKGDADYDEDRNCLVGRGFQPAAITCFVHIADIHPPPDPLYHYGPLAGAVGLAAWLAPIRHSKFLLVGYDLVLVLSSILLGKCK